MKKQRQTIELNYKSLPLEVQQHIFEYVMVDINDVNAQKDLFLKDGTLLFPCLILPIDYDNNHLKLVPKKTTFLAFADQRKQIKKFIDTVTVDMSDTTLSFPLSGVLHSTKFATWLQGKKKKSMVYPGQLYDEWFQIEGWEFVLGNLIFGGSYEDDEDDEQLGEFYIPNLEALENLTTILICGEWLIKDWEPLNCCLIIDFCSKF